jgi:signal transduction histidine kinase
MLFQITIMVGLVLAGVQSPPDDTLSSDRFPVSSEEHYLLLNIESGEPEPVPAVPATVDSLAVIAEDVRTQNSRLSYHLANEALTLAQQLDYEEGIASANNLVGLKYFDFGEYDTAMKHFLISIEIDTNLDRTVNLSEYLNNIALVHVAQTDYEQAAEYLSRSLNMERELGRYKQGYRTINNLGVVYRRQGMYDDAMNYFRQAQQFSLEVEQDSTLHKIAVLNIGNTFRSKGDLVLAEDYLKRALRYFRNVEDTGNTSVSLLFTSYLYRDWEDFETALHYAMEGLNLSRQELQRDRIRDGHELVSALYDSMGNYKEAYRHHKLYAAMSDTLLNLERSNTISEMQTRFEVERMNREIELLNRESRLQEAQIEQQGLQKGFLLSVLFLTVVIAGLLYFVNRQRKKSNAELNQRQKEIEHQNRELAKLNKEKDDFLGMAAHDLRNPLSGIRSAVELIKMEEDPTPQILREYTELIQISTDRMLDLLNDLLDIQSLKSGRKDIPAEPVNVQNALSLSLANFNQSAEAKNIRLETVFKQSDVQVMGSANGLVRVFDNLISNAIKFSPRESTVTIRIKKVDKDIRIEVKDTGPGISADEQEKLFSRFARLSNVPTGNETSTGLGLYIVKKIVSSMNGKVWCTSKAEEGATFVVQFPVAGHYEQEHGSGKTAEMQQH